MTDIQIFDNAALHRFELTEDEEIAFLLYSRSGNSIRLIHTEVPEALRGRGVGSTLVGGVLGKAQDQKLTVIPLCPFVVEYLKSHPEFYPIIDPVYLRRIQAQ
ncbi:MAG TPA: GNAT family N-acetyltransferase [Candidatus Sulfotelmatobacter sp.]|nr:GNAT family N-acetyltransferase [Candidatus Sulfotelmatobacter sp.]